MDLNTFTIDQLPYQTSEALPKDCTKYDVMMGAVPDEKDNTNPVSYMDEIFAAGGDSPVPPTPVGPKDNEIWYTGEYYDLANVINILSQEVSYVGPAILSNEQVGDKYVITFDGPVTELGAKMDSEEFYPIFMNQPEMGVECDITGVEIPNSVTSIGYIAFSNCTSLTSVTIPNSVTSIGDAAFMSCSGLTSMTIPNSVTSIGGSAFAGCSGLTSVTIPDSVTSIGNYAFQDCSSLPVIDNIRYADTYLVKAVDKTLSSYTIKEGTRFIGTYAFAGCTSLETINIPNSVTEIGEGAFLGCTGLTSVTIPNSVTSIGKQAFYDCSGLTSVTCEAITPPTLGGNSVFDDTNNCPIYVPAQSVDAYEAAENWSAYADRIQAIQ